MTCAKPVLGAHSLMSPTFQPIALSLRSYQADGHTHTHDFEQLVLPVHGAMEIEIDGHGKRLAQGMAAYVTGGSQHAQSGRGLNKFLVLDVRSEALEAESVERFSKLRFFSLSPAAQHLVDYMALSAHAEDAKVLARNWLPLLIGAMSPPTIGQSSRLASLLSRMSHRLSHRWTVPEMAAFLGVSSSRLHGLFIEQLRKSPQAWLAEKRLEQACKWLSATEMPIAEIAGRTGYSDQTSLTRAFRRSTNYTPAEYRRLQQELQSKAQ